MDEPVCEYCGTLGFHPECHARAADEQRRLLEQLRAEFGLIPVVSTTEPHRVAAGFDAALALAVDTRRRRRALLLRGTPDRPEDVEPPRDPRSIAADSLHNEKYWYVADVFIGCGGYIVDKTSARVETMGSLCSLRDCFWAYENGISFEATDLTIRAHSLAGKDLDNLVYALATTRMGTVSVAHALETLPAEFDSVWLPWLAIPQLRRWHDAGVFSFTASPLPSRL